MSEEEEEEETLNRDILSSLQQAIFLVFIQIVILLYSLWKPPTSEALMKKLDELLAGVKFPLSHFEGTTVLNYDAEGNLKEVIQQDSSLPKRKKITLTYEQGNLKTVTEEWIELEKGE